VNAGIANLILIWDKWPKRLSKKTGWRLYQ